MNILNISVMSGPNLWSVKRSRLVVLNLDIGELEFKPTNEIEGFYERISTLFPGLFEHHCSVGEKGGFFARVKEGTWIGHVIEHVAIELQVMAGIEAGFGQTRGTGVEGQYMLCLIVQMKSQGGLLRKKLY